MEIYGKTDKWKEVASLPVCCTAHTAVMLHENIYVGGGSEEIFSAEHDYQNCYKLDVYNLTTNQWSTPITTPHSWFALAILDNKVVIAGGMRRAMGQAIMKKNILILNAGQWEDYNEMPTARCQATAVAYQSMLTVIGGMIWAEGKRTIVSTIEILNTTNGSWYTCNNLPSPYSQLKPAVIDDKLYLIGGFNEHIEPSSEMIAASLDTLLSYKLNWQSLPNAPWHFSTAAVLHNKFLLTVGGRKPLIKTSQTCEVCIFNPSSGVWECIANIPEARSLPAAVGMDDKIVVIGGTNKNRKYCKNVWIGEFK